ncbi:MAG TPA: cohesin domain-containing protein [Candidatus Saccharimonadales bacterium]|nr:cohesin domain-containing protein [Candidatus Saccharimonadales bacterium]
MNTVQKKQAILFAVALALLISIPLTVSQLSQQQNENGHAAKGASLAFTPASSASSPIKAKVGDSIDIDINVDPGNSLVTFIRYQIQYDKSKVQLVNANPATLNSNVFTNVEGPVINTATLSQSVSIGSDPTKAISKVTKVATLHFKAIGSTNGGTTNITYGTLSQALSSGANDQANQNVLSTTTPAVITISGTGGPTDVPSSGPGPSTLPIPTITGTALNFSLLLHGVGAAGDNPNPTGNSLSNKNPLHPQRNLQITVYDTTNKVVANSQAPVTYDVTSGMFIGAVGLPSSVQTGNYSVKIQTDRYLRKLVPGIQQVVSGQQVTVAPVQLIAGDSNNDNVLNVLDYNAMLDCGYGQLNPLPMNDPNAVYNSTNCKVHTPTEDIDINDDGIINSTDYNLFLRELSVQNGD